MVRCDREELQERRAEALSGYTVLTPAEAMDILNIGKNSMYSLLNSGKLDAFRVGRSWRISTEALEAYIQKR